MAVSQGLLQVAWQAIASSPIPWRLYLVTRNARPVIARREAWRGKFRHLQIKTKHLRGHVEADRHIVIDNF